MMRGQQNTKNLPASQSIAISLLFIRACLGNTNKVCVSKHCVFSIYLQLSFKAVTWTQPVCFALQVLTAAMKTTFLLLFLSSAATAISLSLSVCVVLSATNRGAGFYTGCG
jgi:hypothetical protein